jgi:ribosomal protein L34
MRRGEPEGKNHGFTRMDTDRERIILKRRADRHLPV